MGDPSKRYTFMGIKRPLKTQIVISSMPLKTKLLREEFLIKNQKKTRKMTDMWRLKMILIWNAKKIPNPALPI